MMYNLIKRFYDMGLWDASRVNQAVGRWITQEQANTILGIE